MSRNVTNQLIWISRFGRTVNYRSVHRLPIARISNANQNLFWSQNVAFSMITRDYSTQQSPSDTSARTNTTATSTILPKINTLLSETKLAANQLKSNRIITGGRSLFRRQWDAFFNWYDEISHTNEVREAHKQVESLQDKLSQAQQLRRDVSKELSDIRYELQVCYADQANCAKGDPRYLELIRREIEVVHPFCFSFEIKSF